MKILKQLLEVEVTYDEIKASVRQSCKDNIIEAANCGLDGADLYQIKQLVKLIERVDEANPTDLLRMAREGEGMLMFGAIEGIPDVELLQKVVIVNDNRLMTVLTKEDIRL